MKITRENSKFHETQLPTAPLNHSPKSDLSYKPNFPRKPTPRKIGIGVRLRKESGAPSGKRSSRPETPLLRWKFDETNENNAFIKNEKLSGEVGRKGGRRTRAVVSARKLGAALWRIHSPKFQNEGGQSSGFQFGNSHTGVTIHGHHVNKVCGPSAKDMVDSPHSVSGPKNRLLHKSETSFQFSNSMKGATKWDPDGWKTLDALKQVFGCPILNQQRNAAPVISALEVELEQAQSRINELETEHRSSKKKLEQFLQKLSEERAAWRSREHEKIRSVINNIKADLSRERKNRQRLEMVNSKLANELADAKLSARRYIQDYEKERKSSVLIEEICDELARELGEEKAQAEVLKRELMKLQEEVEEDRKMLQIAEVWREERVQMKLVDAKAMLEEKYSQMNRLMVDLETFLNARSVSSDVEEIKKAEFLRQAAASVNMQDVRELTYEPTNPDDVFSALEDVNFGAPIEEVNPHVSCIAGNHASKIHTVSPEVNLFNKDNAWRHSNAYFDQSGELEEDGSEWETVSHLEDEGSSYSPDGSDHCVEKTGRGNNASRSRTEWERNEAEELPVTDVSEIYFVPTRHTKKVSSISRLWRSYVSNGDNYKIISEEGTTGKLSNGAMLSPDRGSAKSGISPRHLVGQWSSPESRNPHVTQGMKGCIEWPRNAQKGNLKPELIAAKMGSEKIQLRHVLKQKY